MASTNQPKIEGMTDEPKSPDIVQMSAAFGGAGLVGAPPDEPNMLHRQFAEATGSDRYAVAMWRFVDNRVEFALHLKDAPHAEFPVMVAQLKDHLSDQLRKATSSILSGNGAPFPRLPGSFGIHQPDEGPSS